jgi:transposase
MEDKAGAEYALKQIGLLYKVESMATDQGLDIRAACRLRQRLAYPILCAFEKWIVSYYPKTIAQGKDEPGVVLHLFIVPSFIQVSS